MNLDLRRAFRRAQCKLRSISTLFSLAGGLEQKKGTIDSSISTLFASKWLPRSSTQRTKSVSEIIHCNHIFYRSKQRSRKGSKSKKISKNYSENRLDTSFKREISVWENPVLEGQRYFNLHLSGDYPTYETIARKFGLTRARICQMIALAKNLPDEITGLFSDSRYSEKLQHITERKLRPLTLMKSNSEKIEAFENLMRSKTNSL